MPLLGDIIGHSFNTPCPCIVEMKDSANGHAWSYSELAPEVRRLRIQRQRDSSTNPWNHDTRDNQYGETMHLIFNQRDGPEERGRERKRAICLSRWARSNADARGKHATQA